MIDLAAFLLEVMPLHGIFLALSKNLAQLANWQIGELVNWQIGKLANWQISSLFSQRLFYKS